MQTLICKTILLKSHTQFTVPQNYLLNIPLKQISYSLRLRISPVFHTNTIYLILFITHFKNTVFTITNFIESTLQDVFVYKAERSLIFSSIKKSSFLKSMILINFLIQRYLNILNLFNISMIFIKWIIRLSSFDVTI